MFDISAYTHRNAKLSLLKLRALVTRRIRHSEIERQAREREAKTAKLRVLRMAQEAEITAAAGLVKADGSSGNGADPVSRFTKRGPRKSTKPLASAIQ